MLRKCFGIAALMLLGSLLACSDDDSEDTPSGTGGSATGGSGGATTGAGGDGCDPTGGDDSCPAYTACATSKCTVEYEACLGPGYASGNFAGGDCADYMTCNLGCDCDTSCTQACYANASAECTSCMTGMSNCLANNCQTELNECAGSTGGTGGGGGGGATCDDLAACCATLTGADQTNCQSTYDSIKLAGDATCGAMVNTYQASGKCL